MIKGVTRGILNIMLAASPFRLNTYMMENMGDLCRCTLNEEEDKEACISKTGKAAIKKEYCQKHS